MKALPLNPIHIEDGREVYHWHMGVGIWRRKYSDKCKLAFQDHDWGRNIMLGELAYPHSWIYGFLLKALFLVYYLATRSVSLLFGACLSLFSLGKPSCSHARVALIGALAYFYGWAYPFLVYFAVEAVLHDREKVNNR